MDEILNSLFRQVLKYENAHYKLMAEIGNSSHNPMLTGVMSGTVYGLRIAICLINGWEIDDSDEGIADQAVRTYAETHNLGEVE